MVDFVDFHLCPLVTEYMLPVSAGGTAEEEKEMSKKMKTGIEKMMATAKQREVREIAKRALAGDAAAKRACQALLQVEAHFGR